MGDSWPKIVLFGDSLTEYSFSPDGCWGSLLANHLQRKCDVICRGFCGYNSRWCRLMLPKLITAQDAADIPMVTIFLGANDSVDAELSPKQHVPLEEFKQNLVAIIQYLKSIGIEPLKVLVISPPATVEAMWEAECKKTGKAFGKFNEPTKHYAKACIDVAMETGTRSVDLYTAMMQQQNWERMLSDGLHLSKLGSEFLFQLLQPIVDKHLGHLPTKFPYWADIDNNNPHPALDKWL